MKSKGTQNQAIFEAKCINFSQKRIIQAKKKKDNNNNKKLSNDPGKVDSNFFCYAAMMLSPHKNVLIFTQRMYKPT